MKNKQQIVRNNSTLDNYIIKKSIPTSTKPTKQYLNPIIQKQSHQSTLSSKYPRTIKQADSQHTEVVNSPRRGIYDENVVVCQQLIMIGPSDVDYFSSSQNKLRKLLDSYSKANVIRFISENTKFVGILALKNLQAIDDENFWGHAMPKMLKYATDEALQDSISSCIEMLLPRYSSTVTLSRAQIMMILINMFLHTFPKQSHRSQITFAFLMQQRQNEDPSKSKTRLQKLKCIVDYFNKVTAIDISEMEGQFIEIHRLNNRLDVKKEIEEIQYTLKDVKVMRGLIEERVGIDLLVDFANKKIGGGVLKNGAVQEEILFMKFIELFATIPITYELEQSEAIIVYNVKQWVQTEGYSHTFEFIKSKSVPLDKLEPATFIAIDAFDFSSTIRKGLNQYTPGKIEREIGKAFVGFNGVQDGADGAKNICTGRWGCGAFKGDMYLKLLIQWIAASMTGRNLNYMAQEQEEQREIRTMVQFIKKLQLNTYQLLQTILEYHKFIKLDQESDFLSFIKRALV